MKKLKPHTHQDCSREAFEKFMLKIRSTSFRDEVILEKRHWIDDSAYANNTIQIAWEAWQESAKRLSFDEMTTASFVSPKKFTKRMTTTKPERG